MNKILFIVAIMVGLCACTGRESENAANELTNKEEFVDVLKLPDNLATPEQLKLKRDLMEMACHTIVVDNRMVLDVTKDYLKEHNIPIEYLEIVQEQYEANNRMFQELEDKGVEVDCESDVAEMISHMREYIKAYDERGISLSEYDYETTGFRH